jgi:NADPH-dependent glutamate synthase beta subunit-like oxidoreductase
MIDHPRDLTAPPDLIHGRSRSGPVREQHPVYVDLPPPCNAGCPAGENIQAWLALATEGRHQKAWRGLVADNPPAAIHGRVCYHPCESVFNGATLDNAVSIHSIERFLGDLVLARGCQFDPPVTRTGKRVLVIGSGPSGLPVAYHLSRLGHEVEIRDPGSEPGEMMRCGIPAYRLPRDVIGGELDRIAALGVRTTCDHRVEDLAAERDEGNFDATGRFETLAADTVILALGQETDTSFLRAVPGVEFQRDGTVTASASLMKPLCPDSRLHVSTRRLPARSAGASRRQPRSFRHVRCLARCAAPAASHEQVRRRRRRLGHLGRVGGVVDPCRAREPIRVHA